MPVPNPNPISVSAAFSAFLQHDMQLEGLIGGVNSLDTVTTGEGFRWLAAVDVGGSMYFYKLRYGMDAESLPTIVRPKDYNPDFNAQVWERVPTPGGGGGTGEVYRGSGSPEGVQVCVSGACLYVDSDDGSVWSFNGVAGADTGWI